MTDSYFKWAAKLFDPARIHEKPEALPGIRMARTPPRLKWACRPLGYHNAHVYAKYFGLGPRRLAELKKQGVL